MIKSCLPSDGTVPWLRTESKTLKDVYAVSINMIDERSHRECRNLKMVRGMAIADFYTDDDRYTEIRMAKRVMPDS